LNDDVESKLHMFFYWYGSGYEDGLWYL